MKKYMTIPLALGLVLTPVSAGYAHEDGFGPDSASSPSVPASAYGHGWQSLPSIAGGPRQEHSVAAVKDQIYVLGGIAPNPSGAGLTTTNRVEIYNTKTGVWTDAAPLPVAMNHPNVAVVKGKIYVLGGLSGGSSWQALASSYVYDPGADRWTEIPSMPLGTERGSAAVGVHGDNIYLAGGMRSLTPGPGGPQDTVATVSSFNVRTQQWTNQPDLPEARDHVGGAVIKGTLYVLGGRDRGQINVQNTVYALDLNTSQWQERAPMPTPRGGVAASALGDKIYVFGGEGNPAPGSKSIYSENEVYDVSADSWQQLAPMPVPRHGTAAVTVGKSIYIPGGGDAAGGTPVAVSDAFTPAHR